MNKVSTDNLTKLYYTIGEVSSMFNVNTSLIRFWEKEFQVISPKKNRKGNRLFTIKDIENINKIYHLVKIKGFTLDGAKNSLKAKEDYSHEEKLSDNEAVIERLKAIKELFLSMKIKLYFLFRYSFFLFFLIKSIQIL